MNKDIEKIKMKALPILKKYGIVKAGIFGSYARGDNKKNSDIDILVLPPNGIGFEFFGIQSELEKKLKKRVDLLSYRAIHPLLKERILKEEVKIL